MSATSPYVQVRPSAIHGNGVFARTQIHKGTEIGTYQGVETKEDGPHVLWITEEDGRSHGIDGKNELRYVNHSRTPNASFEGEQLVAVRTILPGEEVTHHYGSEWEETE